ncbi:SpoIIE family protein phosphatase [Phocaeicola sp.]
MVRPFFHSFATRLSIYVLSFTLIVFTVVMVSYYSYSEKKLTEYAVDYTHGQLTTVATQINSLLQRVETTLTQSTWIVEKELAQPDSLCHIISSIVENEELIVGSGIAFEPYYYKEKGKYFMLYASREGAKISTQVLGSQQYDYPCMDWYLIPKLKKQNYWSEPYYDKGGGNEIMSTYSMPLYNKEGEVYAIFTANISLSHFTDMVGKLKLYASSYTYLVSRHGSFLTHANREKILNETIFSEAFEEQIPQQEYIGHEMLAGHTGTLRFNNKGVDSYAFYTSIPNNGWSVCTVYPSEVILSDLHETAIIITCLSLASIIILFFLINFIIYRQARPLKEFSKSARAIATGQFDIELPKITSQDEIKDLHDSLVYMQHSLSTYVEELRHTTAAKERIESELSIAREIQMGMIPKIFPPFPERKDVDLQAVLYPAKEVGGDLYDFFIEDEMLYFIIGDVSGKGVPASLFMAITRSLFRTLSSKVLSPAAILSSMNSSISETNESAMFVTLIVGILDLHTGKLKLCNAGHNAPVLVKPDGSASFLELKNNLFAGIVADYEFTNEEFTLAKGSKLFLYTDGVTEAENEYQELYSDERLLNIVQENSRQDVRQLVDTVTDSIKAYAGKAEQSDDLTVLVIHYEPTNIP